MRGRNYGWNSIAFSEIGAYRQDNQDVILALQEGDAGLFAVADGMGGHFRGELASRIAADSLRQWWDKIKNCISSVPFLDVVSGLEKKVKMIHRDILAMYEKMGQCGGTTLCLLFVKKDAYAVMNIGDSRLYKCQGRTCIQLTVDDVWENQPQFRNARSEESEMEKDASYGMLVQALGAQEGLKLPVITDIIDKRTRFLLCSDGIYKYIENKLLLSQLQKIHRKSELERAAARIKKEVYQNGAKDNLSLILVLAEPIRNSLLPW